jgi:hypothetical protein
MKHLILFIIYSLSVNCVFSQTIKDCRTLPAYASKLGYDTQKSGFSTSEQRHIGLTYVEFGSDGKNKVYQHKSWKKAGFLGPILILENGDLIVAPTPSVNILYNKAEEQNFLYRIEASTQEMKKMIALPYFDKPNAENPFGLIGLAYDCDTKIIYAASLAGSTRKKENGKIFAIQSAGNKIVATIDSSDCMGIGLGYVNGEKRLFMGKTRSGEILSVALNTDGSFKGTPRKELSLDGLGPRGDDVARKIRFLPDGSLQIQAVEFYYNLIAPTEKQESKYIFKYMNEKWVLVQMQ